MTREQREQLIKAIATGEVRIIRQFAVRPKDKVYYAETFLDYLKYCSCTSKRTEKLILSDELQAWFNEMKARK